MEEETYVRTYEDITHIGGHYTHRVQDARMHMQAFIHAKRLG